MCLCQKHVPATIYERKKRLQNGNVKNIPNEQVICLPFSTEVALILRDCAPYGRTYTYTAQYNYVICQDVSGLSPEVHQADLVLCNCMQCWQQHNEMMIGLPKPCLIRCHLLSLGDILQFHSCKTSHQEKKQQKNCMILKHKITFRLCITYFYNITRKQRNRKQRKFKTPSLCCP